MQSRKCWAAPWLYLRDAFAPGEVQWCWKCPVKLPVTSTSRTYTLCKLLSVPPSLPCSAARITKEMTKIEAWFLIYLCFMFAARTLPAAPATAAVPFGVWTRCLSPKQPQFCLPNPRAGHSCSSLEPGGRKGIISASHTAGSLQLVSISVANMSWSL